MRATRLNMHDAKTHLSRHLAGMKPDDRLIICNRNRPVAEVRLLPQSRPKPRKFGVARGQFRVSAEFFEPLPDAVLAGFEGRG
ncbi:MAG: type II toxin-antitoxin system Phd/YefM family antitoxin [Planctomycetia bacterium]|nr:type II toxin-antitoxin system Phd/YefM family antitoxin [Planctomycetia bacterium]